jgi:hypothetical protein
MLAVVEVESQSVACRGHAYGVDCCGRVEEKHSIGVSCQGKAAKGDDSLGVATYIVVLLEWRQATMKVYAVDDGRRQYQYG